MDKTDAAQAEIIPYMHYRDVGAALDWLARVFGFQEEMRHETGRGGLHGEMRFGGQRIMLGSPGDQADMKTPAEIGGSTQGVFVYLQDVAGHHARAVAAGTEVDGAPVDRGYGLTYSVRDLEGHPWYFTQQG